MKTISEKTSEAREWLFDNSKKHSGNNVNMIYINNDFQIEYGKLTYNIRSGLKINNREIIEYDVESSELLQVHPVKYITESEFFQLSTILDVGNFTFANMKDILKFFRISTKLVQDTRELIKKNHDEFFTRIVDEIIEDIDNEILATVIRGFNIDE